MPIALASDNFVAETSTHLEEVMDTVMLIRVVAGMLVVGLIVPYIFYLITLSRALSKCSIQSRTMEPGTVWLLFVPVFSLVWHFFVVLGLAKSLGNEFRARNAPSTEPEPGKSIGIAMCVCAACGIIPIVNLLALPAHLVLWIIYWVKIADFSRMLDQLPAMGVAPLYAQQDLPPGMPPSPPWTGRPTPPVVASRPVPVIVWVLVGLAAFIPVVLILMLMAIPTIGVMKRYANETSAINSVQAIIKAETQYSDSFPANGYACSLSALGGEPGSGSPTPTSAELIQSDLASGYKSGYIFNITNCTKGTVNDADRITGFTVTAVPQAPGKTGDRGFCSDESGGSPKYDPTGGTDCTQTLAQ
ncbi:MAG: hypothetical protein ACLQHF_01650 [Terracidiphilus sp.]